MSLTSRRAFLVGAACLSTVALAACTSSAASTPATGGSLSVLMLGSTYGSWNSLDPLTDNTSSINYDLLNAIYGQLFVRGSDGAISPSLATAYTTAADGLTMTLSLRQGVTFSDGTAFDADAVAANLRRDLVRSAACACLENFAAVSSVSVAGTSTVTLHLAHRDPSIVDAFIDEAPNWVASPTALRSLGEQAFALTPVGAGPFTVSSDDLNTKLVLAANPTYWQKGSPKLSSLTFTSVANDLSAYNAMRAGQAKVYLDFGTPDLLKTMKQNYTAIPIPATQTEAVNLNPRVAPFTNPLARQALYYATDPASLNSNIFQGLGTISQSPGGPGDLYWQTKVNGYRSYDPAQAKALVAQLGGLSLTLSAINQPQQVLIAEALQSEWAAVGIKATLAVISIPQAVKQTQNGSMQAIATEIGNYDPSLIPGLAAWYSSDGLFSLVRDPKMDALVAEAKSQTSRSAAANSYRRVYEYLASEAYAPLLFTTNEWNIVDPSVSGITPNLDEVSWQDVSVS